MKPRSAIFYPRSSSTTDTVAEEAPLAIDVVYGKAHHRKSSRLTVTMRSPGHDEELVLGLLFSLGIIDSVGDIAALSPCARPMLERTDIATITAALTYDREFQPLDFLAGHARYAGCGVCGGHVLPNAHGCASLFHGVVDAASLRVSPAKMALAQHEFQTTGGSHAAALFTEHGQLLSLFEDIGRHNALDKLIGYFLARREPSRGFLVMSSRASFEIVQKAARANIALIAVMGAVSTLAVDLAHKHGITLVGFLRTERFNVYTHPERIWGL